MPQSALKIKRWLGVGSGWEYETEIKTAIGLEPTAILEDIKVNGVSLCSLAVEKFEQGKLVSPEQAIPNYVKERMTYVKGK